MTTSCWPRRRGTRVCPWTQPPPLSADCVVIDGARGWCRSLGRLPNLREGGALVCPEDIVGDAVEVRVLPALK